MQQRGWADEVYRAVLQAFDAVHALRVKLHYACCEAAKRENGRERDRQAVTPPTPPGERPGWMNSHGAVKSTIANVSISAMDHAGNPSTHSEGCHVVR